MAKDTEFFQSLTADTLGTMFSDKYKDGYVRRITKSAEKEIDVKAEIERLPKAGGFTKGECEALESLLMASKPSDGLDMSPSLWKLTNGITALARDTKAEKPMRALEIENFAGKLIDNIKLN